MCVGCMCVGVMPCVCEAEGAQWRACAQRAASRAPPRTPRATPRTPAPCACRRVIPVPCAPRTRCRARSAQRTSRDTTLAHRTYSVPTARTSRGKQGGLTNCLKRENKRLHVVVPDPNFANGTANNRSTSVTPRRDLDLPQRRQAPRPRGRACDEDESPAFGHSNRRVRQLAAP